MSDPQVQQLSAEVCVAPQLDAGAMAWAAQNGFKSVVNNRPDFEGGPDQPTSAVIEAAAKSAGLQYAWLPVLPAVQTPHDIARFAAARPLRQPIPQSALLFSRSAG